MCELLLITSHYTLSLSISNNFIVGLIYFFIIFYLFIYYTLLCNYSAPL